MGATDVIAQQTMDDAGVPGLSVAKARGGRLVYAKAFGVADLDTGEATVTVRYPLIHADGWNSGAAGDPQYLPLSSLAAATPREAGPPSSESTIRLMLGNGLELDPGGMAVSSNFRFNVVGLE